MVQNRIEYAKEYFIVIGDTRKLEEHSIKVICTILKLMLNILKETAKWDFCVMLMPTE